MSIKKCFSNYLLATLSLTLCSIAMPVSTIFANENTPTYTEQQLRDMQKIEEDLSQTLEEYKTIADNAPIQSDVKDFYRAPKGSWSWRDGLICVTTHGKGNKIINSWHAAIVAPQKIQAVIEAPRENEAVQFRWGMWTESAPYTVYQVAVNPTTVQQDWNAGYWAGQQEGKPYNGNFWDARRTDKFYCSQLVWAAYYYTAGVDLNKSDNDLPGAIAIHPGEFVTNPNTTIVYRSR